MDLVCVPTRKGKKDLRVVVDEGTLRLLRGLAGVKQQSLSSLAQQAIEEFLAKEENQALIEYHRLDSNDDD